MMMYEQITIHDVRQAFEIIAEIKRPDADNEGDPLNSSSVYNYLSDKDKENVDRAVEIAYDYVRNGAGEPNKRAISQLNKDGFKTHFQQSRYDPYRYIGMIRVSEEWDLDVSDQLEDDN